MYAFDLAGKVAVVTGAASGLGNEYVETLARQGCDVALVDYDLAKAKAEASRISRETGKRIRPYGCDVGSEADVVRAVGEIVADFGRIDILVNNAGILIYGPKKDGKDPYLDYPKANWDRVLRTNLTGPWLMTREAVRQSMRFLGKGKVINIASVGGIRSTKAGCPSYHASKAGVIGLTKSLARELARRNITANAVAPGFIATDMTDALSDAQREAIVSRIGSGRLGEPDDIAHLVRFLASDEASYITGQVICVDGGMSL